MMKNDNSNRRRVIIAAIAASFLILVYGAAYRVLAARLDAPGNATPISQEVLDRFPMQIGDWTGQDIPLDEAVVRATDTDAHLNRRYLRHNALKSVLLYVASGIRARDLAPHCPEVCYTGAGWTRTDRRFIDLHLSDRMSLPCNVLEFSRGALNTKKVVVLDYYIVDGQYCRDLKLLRSKAWRGSGTVRYVAQVQIVTSITPSLTSDSARKIVCAFAVESAPSISRLFEDAEEDQRSDSGRSKANRMFGGTESG